MTKKTFREKWNWIFLLFVIKKKKTSKRLHPVKIENENMIALPSSYEKGENKTGSNEQ